MIVSALVFLVHYEFGKSLSISEWLVFETTPSYLYW